MRVLVTGSSGFVGSAVAFALRTAGHQVVPFDLAEGADILDRRSLASCTGGCEGVVHLAAILEASADHSEIERVNVEGTANVMAAAERAGIGRVVFLSSAAVLGVFKGHRPPDYLPLDSAHRCYPSSPYERSKYESEDLVDEFVRSTGCSAVSLRPPGVWSPETYRRIQAARSADPSYEWSPFWEYGAFIDVRDLAACCVAGLATGATGHARLLVASSDITTSGRTSQELAQALHPEVEWRGGAEYDAEPFRTLVDIDEARRILDWTPRYTWQRFVGHSDGSWQRRHRFRRHVLSSHRRG